tara:strand:+ start:166 stop:984 length:819 start_codon:yes stop_codon:yes gene_type:complete
MGKVEWDPIKPGDARDVAKINTAFSSFNTQSANIQAANVREEGLDWNNIERTAAQRNDPGWSKFAYWEPRISGSSSVLENTNIHKVTLDLPMSGLDTNLGSADTDPVHFNRGDADAFDMKTTSAIIPDGALMRWRASVHFCPSLAEHGGIPAGSSRSWPGIGSKVSGTGASTDPTMCLTVGIKYRVNGAGSDTVLVSRVIGESVEDQNRVNFDAVVSMVGWIPNTSGSNLTIDYAQLYIDTATNITDSADGEGYFTITAASLQGCIFTNVVS